MSSNRQGDKMGRGTITTFTGLEFDPLDPRPETLRIQDIAHALSLLCRGNGHCRTFYSVGQHCIAAAREALARGCGNRVALGALLHDATECYLSDVPHPYKAAMPRYRELEERLLTAIFRKFLGGPLPAQDEKAIRQIDRALMYSDLHHLMDHPENREMEGTLLRKVDYRVRPFQEVEAEYLQLYGSLKQ
ncbi:MAG: hypothetical protein Q4F92_08095 [Acidaminococcus sp.]|uniref:hypothetical protein n=1 Tax=Acidaminococcus TaxID=904 RepID=UPI0026DEA364|nr:hypothetical protein [Acidaminococcus sp.]MDO5598286.1 hypothetical protein [Acidaminococcus sp.]